MDLELALNNDCRRDLQSWHNLGGYRLQQHCSARWIGSHNGYIIFSLLLGCGCMRRFRHPRSPITLLGLWERRASLGSQCRALAQAAELKFGLPTAFTTPEDWQTKIKEDVFDVVQCAQRIYTGDAASESGVSLERPQKWAKWVFSLEEVWQDDAPMPERTPHCAL